MRLEMTHPRGSESNLAHCKETWSPSDRWAPPLREDVRQALGLRYLVCNRASLTS